MYRLGNLPCLPIAQKPVGFTRLKVKTGKVSTLFWLHLHQGKLKIQFIFLVILKSFSHHYRKDLFWFLFKLFGVQVAISDGAEGTRTPVIVCTAAVFQYAFLTMISSVISRLIRDMVMPGYLIYIKRYTVCYLERCPN